MIPIITDEHINIIEKELLPEGCSFNEERRTFIKCLGSRDIDACAGSGKTTALIAKLIDLLNIENELNKKYQAAK